MIYTYKLNEAFYKYDCDKLRHNYASFYSTLFSIKHPYSIFEVGLMHGASAMSWAHVFPECYITVVENNVRVQKTLPESNFRLIEDDVTKISSDKLSIYDFVIDDGSHTKDDVIATFNKLWPHVASSGFYVIEDVHCAYHDAWGNWIDWVVDMYHEYINQNGYSFDYEINNEPKSSMMISSLGIIAFRKP